MSSGYQLLTCSGPAGICCLRVFGPLTRSFLDKHVPMRCASLPAGMVRHARLLDESGNVLDDILISVHVAAPTLDIRLHLHGSPWLVARACEMLQAAGVMRSSQAVWEEDDALAADLHALLPRILTRRGAQWACSNLAAFRATFDHLSSLDGAQAQRIAKELLETPPVVEWFTRPARVALIGPPNAGKSTLMNCLAREPVSIVSATPGTTRDWVEITTEHGGFPVTWIDTAGLRAAPDEIERAGIERTHRQASHADAVVVLLDCTSAISQAREFIEENRRLDCCVLAWNKIDLCGEPGAELLSIVPSEWRSRSVSLSALQQQGVTQFCEAVFAAMGRREEHLGRVSPATDLQRLLLERIARGRAR